SIPGNRLRPIFLSIPFFLFLIWFLLIYSKYLLSPESPKLDFEFHGCIQDLLWMTIPSFIILFYIINKRIPINKTWIGYLLLTASSSIGAIGVLLLCPDETFYHLVKVHFSPIFTLSLSGFLIGKIILKHPI
ncbi:MAG TPA: NrsF family protein, partial [Leptospiraceae bacterium]|nr:NrsF family protein [Leptospiraceae bacterium]